MELELKRWLVQLEACADVEVAVQEGAGEVAAAAAAARRGAREGAAAAAAADLVGYCFGGAQVQLKRSVLPPSECAAADADGRTPPEPQLSSKLYLQPPVEGVGSLGEGLAAYFAEDVRAGVHCGTCQRKHDFAYQVGGGAGGRVSGRADGRASW